MGNRSFVALGFVFATIFAPVAGFSACDEGLLSLSGDFGEAQFSIDVADDPAEQARGLMFVESMASTQGMLFVYPRPQSVSFWMRNTLIPLDMLFFDETGTLKHIHSMAQPLDETPIFGGDGIQFVLEVNGGIAERFGIAVGDVMQHPSVSDAAIWPCS